MSWKDLEVKILKSRQLEMKAKNPLIPAKLAVLAVFG